MKENRNFYYYPIGWKRIKDGRYLAIFYAISAADLLYNRFIDYLREKHAESYANLQREIEIGSEWNGFISFGSVKSSYITIQGKQYQYKQWTEQVKIFKKRLPFMKKDQLLLS